MVRLLLILFGKASTDFVFLPVALPRGHVKRDWFKSAQEELRAALRLEHNTNVAKNVIIFVGDGMGFTNNWASRIYAGQYKHNQSGEEYQFHFEKFPHLGIAKVSVSRLSLSEASVSRLSLSLANTNFRNGLVNLQRLDTPVPRM